MEEKKTILIDSHVHIYDCYDLKFFFECIINNFNKVNNQLELTKKFIGVLFFTETRETNYFKKIFNNIDYFSTYLKLKIEYTSEKNSFRIQLDSGNYIIVITGQQIITSENLEVLALGTIQRFEYGKSILNTIEEIKKHDSIPVIPWGVGKWFGKRGKAVKSLIGNHTEFFFGDNSGRPIFWITPSIFNEGLRRNVYTLRGTDPLPIKSQEKKVGSFGFYFISKFDIGKPWEFLKEYLLSMNKEPENFGKLESISNFIRNQFLMQFNKLTK